MSEEISKEWNPKEKWPKYKCHKEVRAINIFEVNVTVNSQGVPRIEIVPKEYPHMPFEVTQEWFRKHNPEAGGYCVFYGDGYMSFSPEKAFIDGYTLIPES